MSDSYQAIYDAVRSRISGGNIGEIIRDVAHRAFDTGMVIPLAQQAIATLVNSYDRPSAIFRPTLSVDGNMYCALYGADLMQGVSGFGETADAAMWDFDKNWRSQKAPSVASASSPEPGKDQQ